MNLPSSITSPKQKIFNNISLIMEADGIHFCFCRINYIKILLYTVYVLRYKHTHIQCTFSTNHLFVALPIDYNVDSNIIVYYFYYV